MRVFRTAVVAVVLLTVMDTVVAETVRQHSYALPKGAHPLDVAPDPAGGHVWYGASGMAALGRLDPISSDVRHIQLGAGARPVAVAVGPDGLTWAADAGRNAILSVEAQSEKVVRYPLPEESPQADLNAIAFDSDAVLWFTGGTGVLGSLDIRSGKMAIYRLPRGANADGIQNTPGGELWLSSPIGSYIALIDREIGTVSVVDPPRGTAGLGRVHADPFGILWMPKASEGGLASYDPARKAWQDWTLPKRSGVPSSVFADETGRIWIGGATPDALLRFDRRTGQFERFALTFGEVGQLRIQGRKGEVWVAESAADRLTVFRHE